MRDADLSYTELFWTNTPYFRPAVYEALEELNRVDYSPTYYFRVRQAMRLLETYRQSPNAYAQLASTYQGRFGWSVLPSSQWSFVSERIGGPQLEVSQPGVLHQDVAERFVLLPDIASLFGVRASISPMSAERSTIGSALFVAHQLKRLQGDRYAGFQITRMLAASVAGCADIATAASQRDCEDDGSEPLHSLGWAFDVPSMGLSKPEQRDLKFILTDLRQAGLITYVEDGTHPAFHVVRHPEHAAQFEQFYWDAMAGVIPAELPRQASVMESGTTKDSRSFGEGRFGDHARGVILALNSLMSQVYSFFAGA
jgi:hypothetical protein